MLRHLVVVLGDQLDCESAAFDGFDPARDAVLQMEVRDEAAYVPQHPRRLVYFFAAMRHFRDTCRAAGRRVVYSALDDPANRGSLSEELRRHIATLQPQRVIGLAPGDWRVRQACLRSHPTLNFATIAIFCCPTATFTEFRRRHPQCIMETFYRFMRRRLDVLMDEAGKPLGGQWNFDAQTDSH